MLGGKVVEVVLQLPNLRLPHLDKRVLKIFCDLDILNQYQVQSHWPFFKCENFCNNLVDSLLVPSVLDVLLARLLEMEMIYIGHGC